MSAVINGVTWEVKVGQYDEGGDDFPVVDITQYVEGIQVVQKGKIGAIATGKATVQFDNSLGRFTPGNGLAFSDYPWFQCVVEINATVPGQTKSHVFHGLIRDVSLTDNSKMSKFTITGHDVLTVAARGPQLIADTGASIFAAGFDNGSGGGATPESVIEGLLGTSFDTLDPGITLPKLGYLSTDPASNFSLLDKPTTPVLSAAAGSIPQSNSRQVLDSHILPAGPFQLYATQISDQTASTRINYKGCLVGNTLYKQTADDGGTSINSDSTNAGSRYRRRLFTLTDDTSEDTQLYFSSLRFEHTNDVLCNRCTAVSMHSSPFKKGAQNSESISKYGIRAKTFNSVALHNEDDVQYLAEWWADRFNLIEYTVKVVDLGITNAGIADGGTTTQKRMLGDLLSIQAGIWNQISVRVSNLVGQTTTPAVIDGVVMGRTVRVTKDRFSVQLEVGGSLMFGAFILDESSLDEDRIF